MLIQKRCWFAIDVPKILCLEVFCYPSFEHTKMLILGYRTMNPCIFIQIIIIRYRKLSINTFQQQILFLKSCVDFANFLYHIGCLTSYFLFMHQQKKKLSTLNPHLHIFIDRYMKVVTTVGGWWRKWEICVLILRNAHKSTFSHNVPCSNNVVCLWQYILFKLSPLQNGKFCSYREFKKCKEFIIF